MTYYAENPHLALHKVMTNAGNIEYKRNCRMMPDGRYYTIGIDIDINPLGEAVFINKNIVIFDHELQKNVKSTKDLVQGIVGMDPKDKPIMGYFSQNLFKNVLVTLADGNSYYAISDNVLNTKIYLENPNNGQYYEGGDKHPHYARNVNNANRGYNAEDNVEYEDLVKQFVNWKIPIDKDLMYHSPFIKGLTFGAELETIQGCLPQNLLWQHGTVICKDGSIRVNDVYPAEFVTIPLEGGKGLQTLRSLSQQLAKRCMIDIRCSYHLHMGGIEMNRLFLVSLFRLCCKIQDDIFKMFPHYKIKYQGIKEKNYCQFLPNILDPFIKKDFAGYINDSYFDIYSFLSGGKSFSINNNRKNKINPWQDRGRNKWDIKTRYYWINFVNTVFGKRETIEFRLHSPTLNSDKVVNWVFICGAIMKFAQLFPKRCVDASNISLQDVLNIYTDVYKTPLAKSLSSRLIGYYNERCEYFKKDLDNKDYISNNELKDDAKYSFRVTKL